MPKKIIFGLRIAVIATIAVIFLFSLQNGEESSEQSNWVAEQMQAAIDFIEDTSGIEVNIRKVGHFSEFALLGFEVLLLYIFSGKYGISELFNVFAVGLTTAVTDESIQLFIPERSGQIKDVQIDMCGFVFGALLAAGMYYLIVFIKKRNLNKRGNQNGK